MIIPLNGTTSAKISAELLRARRSAGSPAQGMVLTLIIVCDESEYASAMEASMAAGREHPSRILLVVTAGGRNCLAGCRGAHRRRDARRGRRDQDARCGRGASSFGDPAVTAARLPCCDLVARQGAQQPGCRRIGKAGYAPADRRCGLSAARWWP